MNSKNKHTVRMLAVTAMLSAVSVILMYLEFPVPLVPSFIKFDFSDLPALLASFAYGPVSGIAVCLVKNLLHLLATQTAGIGELANFLIGSSFVVTAGVIYKTHKTKKGAAAASLIASVVMGLFCLPVNYYIIYPLYSRFLIPLDAIFSMYRQLMPSAGGLFSMLCIFNLPFTVVKGVIVSLIAFLIYKPLSPVLHRISR